MSLLNWMIHLCHYQVTLPTSSLVDNDFKKTAIKVPFKASIRKPLGIFSDDLPINGINIEMEGLISYDILFTKRPEGP